MSRQSKKVVAAVDELTQEEREVGGRHVERGQGHRGGGVKGVSGTKVLICSVSCTLGFSQQSSFS